MEKSNNLFAALPTYDQVFERGLLRRDGGRIFRIVDKIEEILEVVLDPEDLPDIDVVLETVREWLEGLWKVIDFPGPDLVWEKAIQLIVLRMVEKVYDRIANMVDDDQDEVSGAAG